MSGFADETLMAFADGALPEAEAARIAAAAAADPTVAARIERFRQTGRLLGDVFRDTLSEPVPARLVATARGIAVVQGGAPAPAVLPAPRPRRGWRAMAAAASVALVVGGAAGFGLGRGTDGPGRLGPALQAALESAPSGGDGALRVLATHRTAAGEACRVFAADAPAGETLTGLACRTPQGWRLRVAVAGRGDGFVPASGGDALLAEALDRLDAGPALAADAEAALLARGWRAER